MAQTITLQRGTVTLTQDTTTLLFTNTSSGASSRIVTGYLSYAIAAGASGYPRLNLGVLRNGATSPNFSVFASANASSSIKAQSFISMDSLGAWKGNSNNYASPGFSSTTTNLYGRECLDFAVSPRSSAYFLPSVMIGPSDAVYAGWYDNGGSSLSGVVQYCMAIITET